MDRFNRTLHGYDPEEVNEFLDKVIVQVEKIVESSKIKDARIKELQEQIKEVDAIKEKLTRYENMDQTLREAILMAQRTSEQMKLNTIKESELILGDAKRNANRIVNDALIKAEATEREAAMLRRNINIFKRKLRDQLQAQLEMVDDIEKVDF